MDRAWNKPVLAKRQRSGPHLEEPRASGQFKAQTTHKSSENVTTRRCNGAHCPRDEDEEEARGLSVQGTQQEEAPRVAHGARTAPRSSFCCFAAVIENVKREVGLAVLEPSNMRLHLAQVGRRPIIGHGFLSLDWGGPSVCVGLDPELNHGFIWVVSLTCHPGSLSRRGGDIPTPGT